MAHKALLEKSGRTIPAENYDSTFSQNTYAVDGKNGKKVYTSRIMEIYANQFVNMFSKSENLFDMTDQGISLKLAHAVPATGENKWIFPWKDHQNEKKKSGSTSIRKEKCFQ